jgi:hypothetical protein
VDDQLQAAIARAVGDAVETAVTPLRTQLLDVLRDVDEVNTALWGDEDSRKRGSAPGLVVVVGELHQDLQKRRTIVSFLGAALSIIGLTNILALLFVVSRFLESGTP